MCRLWCVYVFICRHGIYMYMYTCTWHMEAPTESALISLPSFVCVCVPLDLPAASRCAAVLRNAVEKSMASCVCVCMCMRISMRY